MRNKAWYYYFESNKAVGPLKLVVLIERAKAGQLGPYQLVYREGDAEWHPALALSELREVFINTTTKIQDQWVVLKRMESGALAIAPRGPFTSKEVKAQLLSGEIEYTDYVWKDGMHQWRRVALLREFAPDQKPTYEVEVPDEVSLPAIMIPKEEALRSVEVVKRRLPKEDERPPEAKGEDQASVSFRIRELPRKPIAEISIPEITRSKKTDVPPKLPPLPEVVDRPSEDSKSTNPSLAPSPPIIALPQEEIDEIEYRKERRAVERTVHKRGKSKKDRDRNRERDREKRSEVAGSSEDGDPHEDSVLRHLPPGVRAIWRQAAIVAILLIAVAYKLFFSSDGPSPVPLAPPPPAPPVAVEDEVPSPAPQEAFEQQETLPPTRERAEPEVEEDSPEPVAKPKKRVASRLKIRMGSDSSGGATMSIETDAPPDQTIWLELIGVPGTLADRTTFYHKVRWSSAKPLDVLNGEISPGYYRMRATAGNLSMEEKFEIGTREKTYNERLKQQRKRSYAEFWAERKRLYYVAKNLERQLAKGKRSGVTDLDRMGKATAQKMLFPQIWLGLLEIYSAKGVTTAQASEKLEQLQAKIATLSVYH